MPVATLTSKGQITVPQSMRVSLGLENGDKVDFVPDATGGYREAERRRERPYLYLFWVAPGRLIDGAVGGSGAEFINHSCAPNVVVDIIEGRVFFVSLREIAVGEELLLDYRVGGDAPPMPCRCGAASCRGLLNAP